MMKVSADHVLVIFGASGDLTKRKLIPALFEMHYQNLLPDKFAIMGVGRTEYNDDTYRDKIVADLKDNNTTKEYINTKEVEKFIRKIYFISIDTKTVAEYSSLLNKLDSICRENSISRNYIFYLATPPELYEVIPEGIASTGLNKEESNSWSRIIIEKPFGYDLASSRKLNNVLLSFFKEEQIYRIDHYLGKETVQNIMVTRFSNGIFEPLWNRNYVHHIEITSAESIGIDTRGGYYEKSGALRDMVQNHLLQLAAIIAMEPPAVNNPTAIRNETLKVFQALRHYREDEIATHTIRGQYMASTIRGVKMKGYREEDGVAADSRTETYVALKLFIDNWRWGGVPFYIRTGKRLPTRVTEAVVHFKPTPHKLFCFNESFPNHDNQMVIRIQPDEGILLKFGMKVPGAGFKVQDVNMDFHYSELIEQKLPDAYQRLLLDCMNGDATFYTRSDAAEEAWKFADTILNFWSENSDNSLKGYPAGTWGPNSADDLIEEKNLTWRYPCKNLTNDGIYCEL
jgi:glucose-6-phosphate 1-dehydrogenase